MGGASVEPIDTFITQGIITLLVLGLGCLCLAYFLEKQGKKEEERERQIKLSKQAEAEEMYKSWLEKYTEEHGNPDKIINIKDNDTEQIIIAHESSRKLYILGSFYKFEDVLNCSFSDSPKVIKGTIKAVSSSDTSSMLGRAVVGDVIAGPAGAIIGGSTGKKKTEIQQASDETKHDYTVLINLNSIAKPILRIHIGENGTLTNEIVALMNVIIARK